MGRRTWAGAALVAALAGSPVAEAMVRGVAPELQGSYKQGAPFRCLSGEKEVAFASVNDDYCDCSDGSDEPGTGACSGQEATFFHCENAGSTPQFIYASRVGDGICDCCDGTDEAQLASRRPQGATACPSTCAEEGQRQQVERERKLADLRVGLEAKRITIEQAKQQKVEKQSELSKIDGELPGLEKQLEELRKKKEAADAIKAQEQCQTELPKLRETAKTLQAKIDSLEAELKVLKGDDTTSTTTKKVVSEYAKWMEGADTAMEAEDAEDGGEEAVESKEVDVQAPATGATPAKEEVAEEDPLEKEVKDMEAEVKSRQDMKKQLLSEIAELPEDRLGFASLKDKCLEYKSSEYTYKLCFFKDAKQSHTRLGSWKGFTGPLEASFSNGDMCYGGPARSLKVVFECGAAEAVLDVGEPSRCAYQAVVTHPGACDESMGAALEKPPTRHPKDEL